MFNAYGCKNSSDNLTKVVQTKVSDIKILHQDFVKGTSKSIPKVILSNNNNNNKEYEKHDFLSNDDIIKKLQTRKIEFADLINNDNCNNKQDNNNNSRETNKCTGNVIKENTVAANNVDKLIEYIDKIKEKEEGIEDERQSNEYFSKLLLQDACLSIFIVSSKIIVEITI